MKVYVYPNDLGGCGYYRLIWPARFLQSQGHDVQLVHPKQTGKFAGLEDPNDPDRLIDIAIPKNADVIVLQRVSSIKMVSGIELIRKRGVAVVLDIDDDMKAIHPNNPVFNALNPNTKGDRADYSWQNADKVFGAATYVTASTDILLKRYAREGRGTVLRNVVPEVYHKIVPHPAEGVIGWGGSLHSHPDDPHAVGSSMGMLQRNGYKFRVVGPALGVQQAFMLHDEPQTSGIVGLDMWPHTLNRLSVGIAPLTLTRFNHAKSWLKMLEYATLGVPCIGSPTDEYVRLHRMGVGMIASNPREWYRKSRQLLDSETMREEMSAAGRAATANLTIEANAWRWLEVWETALKLERQGRTSPIGLSLQTTPGGPDGPPEA